MLATAATVTRNDNTLQFEQTTEPWPAFGRVLTVDDGLGYAMFDEHLVQARGNKVFELMVLPQISQLSTQVCACAHGQAAPVAARFK